MPTGPSNKEAVGKNPESKGRSWMGLGTGTGDRSRSRGSSRGNETASTKLGDAGQGQGAALRGAKEVGEASGLGACAPGGVVLQAGTKRGEFASEDLLG